MFCVCLPGCYSVHVTAGWIDEQQHESVWLSNLSKAWFHMKDRVAVGCHQYDAKLGNTCALQQQCEPTPKREQTRIDRTTLIVAVFVVDIHFLCWILKKRNIWWYMCYISFDSQNCFPAMTNEKNKLPPSAPPIGKRSSRRWACQCESPLADLPWRWSHGHWWPWLHHTSMRRTWIGKGYGYGMHWRWIYLYYNL